MTYDLILVPQGAEAAAVRRGLRLAHANTPILAIAMGPKATTQRLLEALDRGDFATARQVLVLGVAGSLSPELGLADVVVYRQLLTGSERLETPQDSLDRVLKRLPQARTVTALSSDRLIHRAEEKRRLHRQTAAQVVDMEAEAIAQTLTQTLTQPPAVQPLRLTTVRVISDEATCDLPNLGSAQRADGSLDGGAMAIALARQPVAALRLIQGSLWALRRLEQVTRALLQQKASNRSDVGGSQGSRRS